MSEEWSGRQQAVLSGPEAELLKKAEVQGIPSLSSSPQHSARQPSPSTSSSSFTEAFSALPSPPPSAPTTSSSSNLSPAAWFGLTAAFGAALLFTRQQPLSSRLQQAARKRVELRAKQQRAAREGGRRAAAAEGEAERGGEEWTEGSRGGGGAEDVGGGREEKGGGAGERSERGGAEAAARDKTRRREAEQQARREQERSKRAYARYQAGSREQPPHGFYWDGQSLGHGWDEREEQQRRERVVGRERRGGHAVDEHWAALGLDSMRAHVFSHADVKHAAPAAAVRPSLPLLSLPHAKSCRPTRRGILQLVLWLLIVPRGDLLLSCVCLLPAALRFNWLLPPTHRLLPPPPPSLFPRRFFCLLPLSIAISGFLVPLRLPSEPKPWSAILTGTLRTLVCLLHRCVLRVAVSFREFVVPKDPSQGAWNAIPLP